MVTRQLAIGSKTVGSGCAPYVIAEAGVNHNGDVSIAHALIEAAADVGADAIKFQTFDPDDLVRPGAESAAYQKAQTGQADQHELLRQLALPDQAWAELSGHARGLSLDFLSTPFDERSLDRLVALDVPAVKISSGDLTNHGLLRAASRTGKPIILSTGAAFLGEVDDALGALGDTSRVVVLHCVTSYPAPAVEANLRSIPALAELTAGPVGWSDHTLSTHTAVLARALGASVFEKHLTLDRTMSGPDHAASADPEGLSEYVELLHQVDDMLGDGVKRPQKAEMPNRQLARRGLYAAKRLPAGYRLREGDLVALRPEGNVPANTPFVGRVLSRGLAEGEAVDRESLMGDA